MARLPRNLLLSEINHIMLRGIGHMNLFETENDFRQFLYTLERFKNETSIKIFSYCLMDNHVHLLLKASPEEIPLFFKRIGVSYASYFNGVYEHTGHVFQNRYKSEAIKDNAHFLNALRYILQNPEKAGICSWNSYSWSSAKCYLTGAGDGITESSLALNMFGGKQGFLYFMSNPFGETEISLEEPTANRKHISDHSAILFLEQEFGLKTPQQLHTMDKRERDRLLSRLKQSGLTVRQLERITGINRNVIQRAKESEDTSLDSYIIDRHRLSR